MWLGEHASTLGRAAAKVVEHAPAAEAGVIKGAYQSGAKEAAEHATAIVSDIEAAIKNAGSSPLAGKLEMFMSDAKKALNNAAGIYNKEVKQYKNIISDAENQLNTAKLTDSQIQGFKNTIRKAENSIAELDEQNKILNEILKKQSNPEAALEILQNNSVLKSSTSPFYSELNAWEDSITKAFKTNKSVMDVTSKNLSSNGSFLQEYIDLLRGGTKEKIDMWSMNPKNLEKLEELRRGGWFRRDNIIKMIEQKKIPLISGRIMGVTLWDKAKRLGFALTAPVAGMLALYSWFSKNDPIIEAAESQNLDNALDTLAVTGQGRVIADNAKRAMTNITDIQKGLDKGLVNNPEETLKNYFSNMNKNLRIVAASLQQWDAVERSSDKPERAHAIGLELERYAYNHIKEFNDLAQHEAMGVVPIPNAKVAPEKESPTDDNIGKVQGFLKKIINPSLEQSGELDAPTVESLKAAEQAFNNRAETKDFSGAFITPGSQNVINYNNLMEAYNRIKKY